MVTYANINKCRLEIFLSHDKICILSTYSEENMNKKKFRKIILIGAAVILVISLIIFLNRTPMLSSGVQDAPQDAPTLVYIFSPSDVSSLGTSSYIGQCMENYKDKVRFEILDTTLEQDMQNIVKYMDSYSIEYAPSVLILSEVGEVLLSLSADNIENDKISEALDSALEIKS